MITLETALTISGAIITISLALDGIARSYPQNALSAFLNQPMLTTHAIANYSARLSVVLLSKILGRKTFLFFFKRSFIVSISFFLLFYAIAWFLSVVNNPEFLIPNILDYSGAFLYCFVVSLLIITVSNCFSFYQTFEIYRLAANSNDDNLNEHGPSLFQIILVVISDISITLCMSVLVISAFYASTTAITTNFMNSMNFDMYLYRGSYDTGSLPVFEMSLKREPLIPKYTLNRRIHRGIDGEIDGVDINVGYKSSTEDIYKKFNWDLIGLLNLMDIGDEAQQIKEYLTGASSIFCDIGKVSQINADTYSVSIKVCPFNTTGFSKYFSRKLSDVINGVSTNIASHFRLYDATKPFNIYQYDRAGNLDGSILVGWTYNQHLLKKSIEEVDAYKARLIDAYWDAQGGYMLPTTSFIAAGMATSVISILCFCLICINATKQLLLRLVSIFNRSFWPVENTPFTFFAFMVSSVLVGVSLF